MDVRQTVRAAGHRCSLINVTRHRSQEADDVYYPDSPIELLRRIRSLRPDVVHIHAGGDFLLRYAALFLALTLGLRQRTVFTFHSGGFPGSDTGRRARRWSVRGFALRRLSAVIGVNAELMDVFRRYGVAESRRHLIPPYVPTFDVESVRQETLPDSLASFVATHSPLFLTVGLLEPEYAIDQQFIAMEDLARDLPASGLLVVGSGSLDAELRTAAAKNSRASHIMICGDVARRHTLKLISSADLLLRTTRYDGDAISVREALTLGTRVIATDNGMRPAGVTLIPVLTPESIAETARQTLATSAPPRTDDTTNAALRNLVALFERVQAGVKG